MHFLVEKCLSTRARLQEGLFSIHLDFLHFGGRSRAGIASSRLDALAAVAAEAAAESWPLGQAVVRRDRTVFDFLDSEGR